MEQGIVQTGGCAAMGGAARGWFIHATVYLAVNLMLATLALLQGRTPMLAPAIGWGVALAIHGTVVLAVGWTRRVPRR